MAQATITVRLQAAGRDETFSKTLSDDRTDDLVNGLLRNDDEELQAQFPSVADRIIELYKRWTKQTHKNLMAAEQRRTQTVETAWP